MVETTLSGSTYLRMAARAKQAGFEIAVVFVGTDAVEINLERVKARVEKGGHDVPEEDQRRRYSRTLANMKKLLPLADSAIIRDDSTVKGHTMVAFRFRGDAFFVEPLPEWTASIFG